MFLPRMEQPTHTLCSLGFYPWSLIFCLTGRVTLKRKYTLKSSKGFSYLHSQEHLVKIEFACSFFQALISHHPIEQLSSFHPETHRQSRGFIPGGKLTWKEENNTNKANSLRQAKCSFTRLPFVKAVR